jgi:hypothetical protein
MKTNVHFRSYLGQFLLELEMLQKNLHKDQNFHFKLDIFFFENPAVYEIILKDIAQLGRPQIIIWRMLIACWIPKAQDLLSEYVTHIAVPLQLWLHERTTKLR